MTNSIFLKKFNQLIIRRHIYGLTNVFRLLPDFFVIGVGRGGTTSLYHHLDQHPCMTKSAYDELGFFDTNYELGLSWYRSLFPTKFHKNRIIAKHGKFMTYDVTPSYIRRPWVPKRLANLLPNSKIIALLRNPIDRAYSHYHMGVRSGRNKTSFRELIDLDIKKLEDQTSSIRNENYFLKTVENSHLARGFYAEQLESWFHLFPENQILILKSEDYSENPHKTLQEIFKFLGLPDYKIKDPSKRNVASYPPMDEKTREILRDYFKEHNEKLYKLVGRDFEWK